MTVRLGLLRSFAAAGAIMAALTAAPDDAFSQNTEEKFTTKDASLFMQFGKVSAGLDGYTEYCKRPEGKKLPKDCDARSRMMQAVIWDDVTHQEALKINIFQNAAVNPKSDLKKYGKLEHWAVPKFEKGKGLEGDCEDYVLLKIHELKKIGVPLSAMSIVHVVANGEGHAVLAVRTSKGDMIFDNLNNDIKTPQETGYKFIQALSLTDKREWRKVEPAPQKPDPINDLLRKM